MKYAFTTHQLADLREALKRESNPEEFRRLYQCEWSPQETAE
ncbi:Uncharacterised protein [Serratia quinivorans]|jgi:hypothetical protein|nr:hypothetical protein [Serratia quinivorans]CAI1685504.1 Uncharacterised protein [Serratia quinivorans]CAI1772105.1 Uncharacterised protein [Serratia quinivorans]CAI2395884.1 Uncharacterised protein [Serratia quinivorans]